MPPLSRRSLLVVTALAVTPLTMFVTACGSDSATSPKSTPSVDTVAFGPNNFTVDQYYVDSSQTPPAYEYELYNWDNAYVEVENWNTNYWDDDRMLLWASLPVLAGRGVVDSAKVYEYQCDWYGSPFTNSAVVLDHVNWGAVIHDSAAFSVALQDSIGTVSSDTTTGWRSVNVTSAVQADYAAKRSMTQFRMRLSTQAYSLNMDNWVEFDNGQDDSDCNNNADQGAGVGYAVIWSH